MSKYVLYKLRFKLARNVYTCLSSFLEYSCHTNKLNYKYSIKKVKCFLPHN